jgi:hypothetical protein
MSFLARAAKTAGSPMLFLFALRQRIQTGASRNRITSSIARCGQRQLAGAAKFSLVEKASATTPATGSPPAG